MMVSLCQEVMEQAPVEELDPNRQREFYSVEKLEQTSEGGFGRVLGRTMTHWPDRSLSVF